MTGADATYPEYSEGAKIAFRVQVKNGVVSTWAADLDDAEGKAVEAPVYCYLGSYTYPAGKYSTEPGSARLYTTAAQTLTDVKIYSLSSSAIVDITGANAAKLVLSDAPSQELAAGDITLTDSFGKVIAATGIETSDFIKGIVKEINPDLIIAIDALASGSVERLNKTIQITDTGISPGGGIGNKRKEISYEEFGVKVIAIGVPTVVDAVTIVSDTINYMYKHYSYNKMNIKNPKNKLISALNNNYLTSSIL